MKLRQFLLLFLGLGPSFIWAQILTTDPVFPTVNEAVTMFFDATKGAGGLANILVLLQMKVIIIVTGKTSLPPGALPMTPGN